MEKMLLSDIHSSEITPIVSLDVLIPVGDAVIADGTVKVKSAGGFRTADFTATEPVSFYLRLRSDKPLTVRVGAVSSNGSVDLDTVKKVTSTGAVGIEQIWSGFDAVGLTVYRDAVKFFVQVECDFECEFRLEEGIIRQKNELEQLSIYANNLEGIIKRIDSKLSELSFSTALNRENIVASPSGKKYFISVDDNGNVISTPVIPNKTLFVGNSLLLGMSFYGMCATGPEKDYFYYVSEAIKAKNPDAVFTKAHGARFEQLEDADRFDDVWGVDPNPYTKRPFAESITSDLDLIIIQLSENVGNEKKLKVMEAKIDEFIRRIKINAPKARIIWVRSWWRSQKRDEIIEAACRRWNIGCIDIGDLYTNDNIGKLGQLYELEDGSKVVAPELWLTHPGDNGMKKIAERIIDYLRL